MGVQVPPRTPKLVNFHRFWYRLNTRWCVLTIWCEHTSPRVRAELQPQGRPGIPAPRTAPLPPSAAS